jgi:hypothetical protein
MLRRTSLYVVLVLQRKLRSFFATTPLLYARLDPEAPTSEYLEQAPARTIGTGAVLDREVWQPSLGTDLSLVLEQPPSATQETAAAVCKLPQPPYPKPQTPLYAASPFSILQSPLDLRQPPTSPPTINHELRRQPDVLGQPSDPLRYCPLQRECNRPITVARSIYKCPSHCSFKLHAPKS